MDPKDLNQLDPKLREAYERVMGTSVQPLQPLDPSGSTQNITPEAPVEPQIPQTFASPQQVNTPEASEPSPVHIDPSQNSQSPAPVSPPPVYQSFNAESGATTAPQTAVAHHSSKLAISTPILVVLGVLFFLAYAALWVMVFGIKLF